MQKGFASIFIVFILTIIAVLGGVLVYTKYYNNQKEKLQPPFQTQKECEDKTGKKCSLNMCQVSDDSTPSADWDCKSGFYPIENLTSTPTPDETANWKAYTNNDLEFKYPSNWNISGTVITSTSPKLRVVIVSKDGTLMNECMQKVSEETKNTLMVKRFERVTTGAMCEGSDPSPMEIWVVPSKDAYSPGISYGYSANESAQAKEIFDQILFTFKFLDQEDREGKFCGGVAANLPQNKCPSGYKCVLVDNLPGAGGTCIKE